MIAKTFNVSAEKQGLPWDTNYDVWHLSEAVQAGSFYLLQTNYDRTGPPPSYLLHLFFDLRFQIHPSFPDTTKIVSRH